MTIKSFIKYFENKYPTKTAEKWDNCGLIFGDSNMKFERVLVALDLTTKVMNEAISKRVSLIITHHPFIFSEEDKSLEEQFAQAPYKESIYKRLENTGIALYTAHTNFDIAKNGMADTFIEKLGFKPQHISGAIYGKFFDSSMNKNELIELLEKKIGITSFLSNIKENSIHTRIAILPGSGSDNDIIASHKAGCGAIVTSDVKWNQWVMIKELGINVIQVTHAMEDVFTVKVVDLLKSKFKDVKIYHIFTEEIATI